MNLKNLPYTIIAVAVAVLISESPSYGQSSWVPPPTKIFTTDEWGDFEVSFLANSSGQVGAEGILTNSSIRFVANDLSADISITPVSYSGTNINVSTGQNPNDWGNGIITLFSYGYGGKASGPVDISALPLDCYELWTGFMNLVGEMIEREDFWEFIDAGENEELYRSELERVRDGYHRPTMSEQKFGLSLSVRDFYAGTGLGRGYVMKGPIDLRIFTCDPPGTADPDLFLQISGKYPADRWQLHLRTGDSIAEVICDAADPSIPITSEDWNPHIAEMIQTLEFFKEQIPIYREMGLIDGNPELELFISKCLERISEYTVQASYDYSYRQSAM